METEAPPNRPIPRWTIALLLAVALVAAVAFAWQRKTTKTLAAQNQQVTLALQQTQAQLAALKTKIDTMTPPPALVAPAAKPTPAISSRRSHSVHAAVQRRHADDPRWKQFQSRLDDQGKQIDATRQDLATARTELTGSIARTHDELVTLERKGERSYFEFDINKSKQFRATGPVGIRLKKANMKHSYADLELMVDDRDMSKKHVNLYEPVIFYASDDGRPVELVINSVSKDHIHGYVATPKYSKTELAAMSGTSTGDTAPERKKLALPKD
ncbi:MAG TPA: hypothetical protein VG897_04425 [Terriglobales bacterium]|nr:hypothetical protein [Terriglobales bacterium]